MKAVARAAQAASVLAMAACAAGPGVDRAYDADVVAGRYVPPEAYAAFLRGSLADAQGQTQVATYAYRATLNWDPDATEATERLEAAAGDAPESPVRASPHREVGSKEDERTILVAQTLTSPDPAHALDELAAWALRQDDASLRVASLVQLAKLAPSRRDEIARAAETLAGGGQTIEARAVAAAAADASDATWSPASLLAARLAVDAAIFQGSSAIVSQRCTRVRVDLEEATSRAVLLGQAPVAKVLASEVVNAEPTAYAAKALQALLGDADRRRRLLIEPRTKVPLSAASWVALGLALADLTSTASLRSALDSVPHEPIVSGDESVEKPALELAMRGAIDEPALTPDVREEIRALLGTDATVATDMTDRADTPSPDADALDARHRCLAEALAQPRSDAVVDLSARLALLSPFDSVVAVCGAMVKVARGQAGSAAARELLSRDPGDLRLTSMAFALSRRAGDTETELRARQVFSWIGDLFER